MASNVTYRPPKSLVRFFTSEKFISLAVGPVGCVDASTEFLTPTGWKPIGEYKDGDLVAQWNKDTGRAEFVVPNEYIKLPCKEFYWFHHGYGLDQMLSGEHRMVYQLRRKGEKYHEKVASEVANWHWRNGADMIRIPVVFGAPDCAGMPYTDDEIRLGVAVCADGTICKSGAVSINIKKQYKKDRLVELLNATGTDFSVHKGAPGYDRYYFYPKISDKVFGEQWWDATEHQLRVIAEELPRWDGDYTAKGLPRFNTKVKASADFAQYAMMVRYGKTSCVCSKTGVYSVMSSCRGAATVGIAGKLSDGGRANNCEVVSSPDGFKYCFSVPSTYLVFRRNGCIFVTGNSTKTTAGILKIAYHAKRMAPCKDGIRRSRCVWIRNTREQLRDTSIPDFLSWFPDGVAGTYSKTENTFRLRFDDVECEVLFRGLDDAKDVRRLLSLQVSFAVMDEFREINEEIFKTVQGRLGRYPNKMMVPNREEWGVDDKGIPIGGCVTDEGKSNAHIWGMTNPPDMETFWEEFLSNPPENCHVTIQPSGRSTDADWLEFLPAGYYDNLAEGKDQDWIDVYIDAKFGKSLAGMPVFRGYSRDTHVAKERLNYIKSSACPVIIGMDAALHPAAIFGQVDYKGRLLILDEAYALGMGATKFIREKVKPILAQRFPGQPAMVIIDPAANTRSQTDEKTVLDIIRSEGLSVRMASTNSIQARISAVDANLQRMIDGEPGFVIDPRCTTLISALAGKYRYRKRTDGSAEDKPDKTHPWSDIADALQYLCLHTDTSGIYNQTSVGKAVPIKNVQYRYL